MNDKTEKSEIAATYLPQAYEAAAHLFERPAGPDASVPTQETSEQGAFRHG